MGWFKEFVSVATGDSTSKVSKAGHDFRDDSGARQGKDSFDKAPSWADKTTGGDKGGGTSLFPQGKGP